MYSNNAHRFFIPTAVFVVALVSSSIAHALQTTVTGEMSKMDGHTTYAIGGDVTGPSGPGYIWFPLSKLEWPLDVNMQVARFEVALDNGVEFGFEMQQNINSDAGKMKDSDWLDAPNSFDVYSESIATLDVETYDVYIRQKKEVKDLVVAVGAGVLYQEFNYLASDYVQVSPSGRRPGAVRSGQGVGITYDVEYIIPYISISIHKPLSKHWLLGFDFSYSPFVWAKDIDHHLARTRPKVSKGTAEGSMYSGMFFTRFIVTKWIYIEGKLSYMAINTSGTQIQNYIDNGEWIGDIDNEITSEQYNYGLSLNVTF